MSLKARHRIQIQLKLHNKLQRLNDLQAEFKEFYKLFELIELIEDEKALEKEQEIFDTVKEQVDDTRIRIKKAIRNCTSKDELFFITRKQ